jgi:hypothetical protein
MARRFNGSLRAGSITLLLLAGLAVAPPVQAETGDCKTVYGKKNKASNGSAKVCLTDFSASSQFATIKVSKQKRKFAPDNVYVRAAFVFGAFNDGLSRLGPNAPKSYSETIETSAADPVGIAFQLCYDRTLKSDKCFKTKVINGGEGFFGSA